MAKLVLAQAFGEIVLVCPAVRSALRECASEARLLTMQRKESDELREQDSELGCRVMRNIAADMSLEMRETDVMVREQLLWQAGRGRE